MKRVVTAILIILVIGSARTMVVAQARNELVYTAVEKQPEFPGGKAALSQYLARNIQFPSSLTRNNYTTGPVAARFIVDRMGMVHDVRVITKPLSKEMRKGMEEFMTTIIAAVEKMPRWRPGQVDGEPVSVFYTLPIEVVNQ